LTGVDWVLPWREARKAAHAVGTIHFTRLAMRLQRERKAIGQFAVKENWSADKAASGERDHLISFDPKLPAVDGYLKVNAD
jgi:hypothetical protein